MSAIITPLEMSRPVDQAATAAATTAKTGDQALNPSTTLPMISGRLPIALATALPTDSRIGAILSRIGTIPSATALLIRSTMEFQVAPHVFSTSPADLIWDFRILPDPF